MTDAAFVSFIVSLVLLFGYITYLAFTITPPTPSARMRRSALKSRMKSRKGVPRLCGFHTSGQRTGQMAVVDSARCEVCVKEGRIKLSS